MTLHLDFGAANGTRLPSRVSVRSLSAPATTHGAVDYHAIAQRLYAERRARTQCFAQAGALFGEPGWDILLELYVAGNGDRAIYVGNACIAADVAQTTGLRWVGKLERLGLLTRDPDPTDGRRGLVRLTPRGHSEMESYLRRVAGDGAQPGLRNR